MLIARTIICFMSLVCCGCQVYPSVQYKAVTTPADMEGMTDSFALQRSAIRLEMPETSGQTDQDRLRIVKVISVPLEDKDKKLAIRPMNNWRSSTTVVIAKVENTDRVASIGTEVTDDTVKRIGQIGGGLISIVKLGASVGLANVHDCSYPYTLDLPTAQTNARGIEILPDQSCMKVALQAVPQDAIPYTEIPTQTTQNYYYSACRDAVITLQEGGEARSEIVRVADSRWVQSVQFPQKGSIISHSICGVSVKTENWTGDSGAQIVDAMAAQGKLFVEALQAKK